MGTSNETSYSMHELKTLAKQILGNCVACVLAGKNKKLRLAEYRLHIVEDRISLHVIGVCHVHHIQEITSCAL